MVCVVLFGFACVVWLVGYVVWFGVICLEYMFGFGFVVWWVGGDWLVLGLEIVVLGLGLVAVCVLVCLVVVYVLGGF